MFNSYKTMRAIDNFVLAIPYLFLKKIPYAWILVVALWTWPPLFSGIFLGLILLGLFLMVIQQRAWEAQIKREFVVLYRDEPRAPLAYQIRNIVLVLAGSVVVGWLLDKRFGLSALQWTLLLAGLMLLYRDALLLGATTVYLVTDKGIAIRYVPGHIDYRLFFHYGEIRNITWMDKIEKVPMTWSVITPTRKVRRGLLLIPNNHDGFSKQIQEVLITPTNMEVFEKYISKLVIVK